MKNAKPEPALKGAIAFTLAATAALVACICFHWPAGQYVKMAASTGFLAIALAAGARGHFYGRAVLTGLFFSWWGDLFLNGSGQTYFLFGLVAFLLAHLAYGAAFLGSGVRPAWIAGGVCSAGAISSVVLAWLYPHLGSMRVPVLAYTAVITTMVILATGAHGKRANTWMLAGAILFYLSDLFVARQRFVTPSPWNGLIGLPVYFCAQVLLAYSVRQYLPRNVTVATGQPASAKYNS